MNRRTFLRRLALGSAAVALAPDLLVGTRDTVGAAFGTTRTTTVRVPLAVTSPAWWIASENDRIAVDTFAPRLEFADLEVGIDDDGVLDFRDFDRKLAKLRRDRGLDEGRSS